MNPRESLKKLAEQSAKIEELLNECGIYFCTGIYFFKLALIIPTYFFKKRVVNV